MTQGSNDRDEAFVDAALATVVSDDVGALGLSVADVVTIARWLASTHVAVADAELRGATATGMVQRAMKARHCHRYDGVCFAHRDSTWTDRGCSVVVGIIDAALEEPTGEAKAAEPAARALHVAEFVNRMAVAYRQHSGNAVREDMQLAVREFGVDPRAFYDEPHEQERLRTEANLATFDA